MLFAGSEFADVGDDGVEEGLRGLGTMAAEGVDQAVFAELVAGFVEGFGDAVGVEGEGLAGAEGALAELAVPFFENAEDRRGGVSRRVFLAGTGVREDGKSMGLRYHKFVRMTEWTGDCIWV
jgi:hypothetical protein